MTELDLRLVGVVVSRNGRMIDTGAGAAALGNPARCVAWLANKLATFHAGLRAGDIVIPGAVHRMVPAEPGDVAEPAASPQLCRRVSLRTPADRLAQEAAGSAEHREVGPPSRGLPRGD